MCESPPNQKPPDQNARPRQYRIKRSLGSFPPKDVHAFHDTSRVQNFMNRNSFFVHETGFFKNPSASYVVRERFDADLMYTHAGHGPLMEERPNNSSHDALAMVRGSEIVCMKRGWS